MSDKLSGIVFPGHLDPVFAEDWKKEQESKSQEIIDRDLDLLGPGIHKGGTIVAGVLANTIDLTEETIGYTEEGQRARVGVTSGIAVPPNATSTIVLRHFIEQTEYVSPSNTGDHPPIVWRDNDAEVIARAGDLADGDIPLFEVTAAAGVVTIGDDLRIFRQIDGPNIKDGIIDATKQASTVKTGAIADLHADIQAGISIPKTFAKAINFVYGVIKNFIDVTFAEFTEETFLADRFFMGQFIDRDDYVAPSSAFPAVCLSKGNHNISATDFPEGIAHLRGIPLRYDPTGANYFDFEPSAWDITSNVATITLKNATAELKLIAALLKDNVVHGSFTNWLTCTFIDTVGSIIANPTDAFAITALNGPARQFQFAYSNANASGSTSGKKIRFYIHRVPGSTTTARLFQHAGRDFYTVGDTDSEWIGGLRRPDQFQGHRMPMPAAALNNAFSGTWVGRTDNAHGFGDSAITTGDPVTDGTNDTPRTGKRTHGPGTGVFRYRWLRVCTIAP